MSADQRFCQGFQYLGLPVEKPDDYVNAEKLAKSFKQCTVLEDMGVTYSTDTKVLFGGTGQTANIVC